MNVLITAGGTREDIDPVRGITNYSTGRLGSETADKFMGNKAKVTYICSENAALPKTSGAEIIKIRNTAQLAAQMENALKSQKYDCVIHAMAVSDYTPTETSETKIPSNAEYITVILKRTPKIIKIIKTIQPETKLVGFKLLSQASEEELTAAGLKLLRENNCDYVLANDLKNITETRHGAILLAPGGITARAETKAEIAEIIYKKITDGAK